MFQPNPKPLIPLIIKARVPGWLLVAALAAQYVFMASDGPSEPECSIKVQEVHISTYGIEFKKFEEAKLKISTSCNSPQKYTTLTASIEEVTAGRSNKVLKRFVNVVQRPDPSNPNFVLIENLTTPCISSKSVNYIGIANGKVHLMDGRDVPVSGFSNKPRLLDCQIGAK